MVFDALISFILGRRSSSSSEKKASPSPSSSPPTHNGFDLVSSQFHFPNRVRKLASPHLIEQETAFLRSVFESSSLGGLTLPYFCQLLSQTCSFPTFMSKVIFRRLVAPGDPKDALLTRAPYMSWWNTHIQRYASEVRFFNVLKGDASKDYLTAADLKPFVEELVNTCPALEFLRNSPVFQARYIDTVLATYLYRNDRHRLGHINFDMFRKSRLVEIFKRIEQETDISAMQLYFSYRHFYVIYRKFWELDTDHDMLLSIGDLSRYGHGCLSTRCLRRIFQLLQGPIFHAAETPLAAPPSATPPPAAGVGAGAGVEALPRERRRPNDKMNFVQFVWFILSEEDKSSEQAWRYWFQIADRDSDGVISAYDIEYFYEEQTQRQRTLPLFDHQDFISFHDIMQQMTDIHQDISLTFVQIVRGGQAEMLFNLLFNLPKFITMENSNPFDTGSRRTTTNSWDQYVIQEYSIAALEESVSATITSNSSETTPSTVSSEYSTSDDELEPAELQAAEEEREGLGRDEPDQEVHELLWAKRRSHSSSSLFVSSLSPSRSSPESKRSYKQLGPDEAEE